MNAFRARRSASAIAVSIVVAVLAGCGVSTQSTPEVIQPSDVPFGLIRDGRSTTTSAPPGATSELVVYFVGPEGLTAVTRDFRNSPTASDAIDALKAGPTTDEAHGGYRSALVPGAIDDVKVANGIAAVDLDSEFLQLGRVEQGFAVAQIVYTLTGLDGVDRVRLAIDGEPLPVARTDGRTTTAPIGRDQVVVPPSP